MSSSFLKVNLLSSETDATEHVIDEKKRKRMISNRESARRSRMKRQKHMEDLLREKASLEKKLSQDNQRYIETWKSHVVMESENEVLEAEKNILDSYLKHLSHFLVNYKDYLYVSEPYLNSWQVHGPGQPIVACGMLKI